MKWKIVVMNALMMIGLLTPLCLQAQSAYVSFDREYYHLLDRLEIRNGQMVPELSLNTKPLRRDRLVEFLDSVNVPTSSRVDAFNRQYLRQDNWEFSQDSTLSKKSLWKTIYQRPSDFYYFRNKDFDVHINPVIYFRGGTESAAEEMNFRNTRGIEIRGSIDRKVGFYTYLSSNEAIFPSWIEDYIDDHGAVPGQGFWKPYGDHGYSYFAARGYLTFQVSKHIAAQVGHDRNFIGNGYRSMILSDFSNPYMFLKLDVNIWKLQYTSIWAQMTADVFLNARNRPEDGRYPQKWFSLHRLSANIGKRLNIGVFESVMASQADWSYFNPVIFYRWAEHQLGTPDKVMLGTDFKWNMNRNMQWYGQFALDEFVFGEFFGIDGKNSKRNKHAIQLGYKYIDMFKVSNLDLQVEYNQVRPYTFQEKFEHQSYTNYLTPITHPLGANFRELIAVLKYQPLPKLSFDFTGVYHLYGEDPNEDTNRGGDILKNRLEGNDDFGLYGHKIGQGIKNELFMGTFTATYMLKHNLFVDLGHSYRRNKIEEAETTSTQMTSVALRLNIARERYNY